jgi:hypothetical protein
LIAFRENVTKITADLSARAEMMARAGMAKLIRDSVLIYTGPERGPIEGSSIRDDKAGRRVKGLLDSSNFRSLMLHIDSKEAIEYLRLNTTVQARKRSAAARAKR